MRLKRKKQERQVWGEWSEGITSIDYSYKKINEKYLDSINFQFMT